MTAPEEKSVASFPDPPASLYKRYTDENVRSGLVPKPPVPVKGKYHMFGAPFCVSVRARVDRLHHCTFCKLLSALSATRRKML